nr:hypothetical protein [Deltaproteobacteria bacterium]
MHRLLAAAAVTLTLFSGCVPPAHAPVARRVGMVTSIAGVVGLMATAALQSYTSHTDDMLTAFSLLSAGGILVFAGGELSQPHSAVRQETEKEKFRRWARILTSRASGAAREGRCPRVRRLEKRVNVYDREVHDFVFMRDAAILKCLGVTPALETEATAPTSPLPLTPPGETDTPSPSSSPS